jgi:hypothetical protein
MSLKISTMELALMVAQAWGKPAVELIDWQTHPLAAGGSQVMGGLGIHRVTGMARTDADLLPFAFVVKGIKGGAALSSDAPADWNYWQREALAYQSGILAALPGGIVAPRCYAVQQAADGARWLWLEEIQGATEPWSMARHELAARHLGQFNGAYLAGHPLPSPQPWMSWGRTRQWVDFIRPYAERAQQWAATTLARRWFGRHGLDRTLKLYAQVEKLLQAFERLPVCYCHHDAFQRNLLDRIRPDGSHETVAIDWALTGFGRIGEEIGVTLIVALEMLAVPARQACELDQAIFAGYLAGLHDVGWAGDVRQVRLGCTTNALIVTGLMWNLYFLEAAQQPAGITLLEEVIHHPFDQIIAQYAELLPFLLDLGDEALTLV